MSRRVSRYIVLCEDDGHAILIRSYLKLCGVTERDRVIHNASRDIPGGNIGWILDQFPGKLEAARQRQSRAQMLLIVMADADDKSGEDRERDLRARADFKAEDPLVVLIPKRHVETWICAATGQTVTEDQDCKRPRINADEIRAAARQIHDWARGEPPADSTCVPSLREALPRWRQIG